MKICFFLQRRFAYIGNAMAEIFKEKYGVEKFCGYVSLRSSLDFLKKQGEIKYTKLLLDEDIHNQYKEEKLDLEYIKKIEEEYGFPNFWPYIEMDRVIRRGQLVREYPYETPPYNHEEIMRLVQVKTKAIIKFLKEERPDFIFFSTISDFPMLFTFNAAKKLGIKTIYLLPSRINNLQSLTEDYKRNSYVEDTFKKIKEGKISLPEQKTLAENYLKEFRKKPTPYSYRDTPEKKPVNRRRQFAFLRPDNLFVSAFWFLKIFIDYLKTENKNDPFLIKPWFYFWDRVKRKFRTLFGFDSFYKEIDENEDYAFFPLQYEPETGTSLFSKFYTDQLWLIKQFARSLPMHFKLYIKEHPAMYGFRPRIFYKELKKIPNVKLIKPTQGGFKIIQNAKIIATLTGTSGWEGVLLKKPVITFGDMFYNILPMVKKCEKIDDLPYFIKEQLENFHYDEKSLIDFLTAIFKESVDVDLIKIWEIEGGGQLETKKDQLIPLVDLIAKKVGLK